MEEVLLDIARVGAEQSFPVALEFEGGEFPGPRRAEGGKDSSDPDIHGYGIQPLVGKEQDAVGDLSLIHISEPTRPY